MKDFLPFSISKKCFNFKKKYQTEQNEVLRENIMRKDSFNYFCSFFICILLTINLTDNFLCKTKMKKLLIIRKKNEKKN